MNRRRVAPFDVDNSHCAIRGASVVVDRLNQRLDLSEERLTGRDDQRIGASISAERQLDAASLLLTTTAAATSTAAAAAHEHGERVRLLAGLLTFGGHVVLVDFFDDGRDIFDLCMLHLDAMRRAIAKLFGQLGSIEHSQHRLDLADLIGRAGDVQGIRAHIRDDSQRQRTRHRARQAGRVHQAAAHRTDAAGQLAKHSAGTAGTGRHRASRKEPFEHRGRFAGVGRTEIKDRPARLRRRRFQHEFDQLFHFIERGFVFAADDQITATGKDANRLPLRVIRRRSVLCWLVRFRSG